MMWSRYDLVLLPVVDSSVSLSLSLSLPFFLQKFQAEIDQRVLRASNENSGFFEASLKAAKTQHARELRLLQEELNEERKR